MRYLVLSFLSLTAFAQADYFEKPLEEMTEFLALPTTGNLTWAGVNKKDGKDCRLTITKTEKAIVFSPGLPGAPKAGEVPSDWRQAIAFVVVKENTDVGGGTEDHHLWSSYFLDDASTYPHPHGQFGIGFDLDLKLDGNGGFTYLRFSKAKHQDLGFERLALLECENLKPLAP